MYPPTLADLYFCTFLVPAHRCPFRRWTMFFNKNNSKYIHQSDLPGVFKNVKTFRWDHRLFLLKVSILSFIISLVYGSSEVPRNPLTRWDVSSIPANGIYLTKIIKNKIKMPNGRRMIKSLVHKSRLHGRRRKGMTESFSREKIRYAPQKESG